MKKNLMLFLLLVSLTGVAQTINNYKYVIVPVEFIFLNSENQYRLNTLTKMHLTDLGFTAFYDNEKLPAEIENRRCDFLYVNVENAKDILKVKLAVTFKDCNKQIVYKSEFGTSKNKEYEKAYREALKNAFSKIKYNYQEGAIVSTTDSNSFSEKITADPVKNETPLIPVSGGLSAEPTKNGYLLINESTSKIEFRLARTSDPKTFIASRQSVQGVLLQKAGEWFFEYYQKDEMVSEKIQVRF